MDKLYRRTTGLIARGRQQSRINTRNNNNNDNNNISNSNNKSNDNNDNKNKKLESEINQQQHVATTTEITDNVKNNVAAHLGEKLSVAAAAAAAIQLAKVEETNNNNNINKSPEKQKVFNDQQQQQRRSESEASLRDCLTPITRSRLNTLAQIGEDWLYLALLGIIMALLSFTMDSMITLFLNTRLWLSDEATDSNLFVQYLAWCVTPILLVIFSTGFVHLCSPTAIGSGIPEMKTILRGVVLNEYLTFRTLIAKIVGLTFALGSGLPLGKEGPSVHISSIVATLLSKLVASFQGIYENESRTSEMVSAACAVGVASTFYAPIGGVLFSIEVTTVYFAVRNYWRGFFGACCGATVWRLLGFWFKNDESISALFKTSFSTDYPFDPVELIAFSFIGATCGLAGAAYIKFHREIVQFFRHHRRISGFLQQNRFVYPIFVTLIITSSTFPPFIGKYTAATLSTHTTIEHLFSNRTWSLGNQDLAAKAILDEWTTPDTNFYTHLVLYIVMLFWTSALASTIPTPSGVFIPVLKMGAAYGRLLGELMHAAYPNGIKYSHPAAIVPGSYAVVGAAAFSGAVTHTVSTSVILFEMTGQIVHIIPVIMGVLIANAVCQSLQPSIYDSIIEIKKLPYLPPIASSNSVSHRILVRDFMNTNLPFVWKEKCSYADLKSLLSAHKKIMSFPLVESPHSMKLLGSIARPDLLKLLYLHLGRERRLQEVCRRNSDTLSPAIHLLSSISGHVQSASGPIEMQLPNLAPPLPPSPPVGVPQGAAATTTTTNELTINLVDQQQQQQQQQFTTRQSADSNSGGLKRSVSAPQAATPVARLGTNSGGGLTTTTSGAKPASGQELQLNEGRHTTQLIVQAARPQNYGATALLARDESLLVECQKLDEEDRYARAELKQIQTVAKMINHYDRGSSMDEDRLDKSIQEVEGHLEKAIKGPSEIVVLVESPLKRDEPKISPIVTVGSGAGGQAAFSIDAGSRNQLINQQQKPIQTPPRSNSIQAINKTAAATTTTAPFIPSSPSFGTRPTKSILKTSSFSNVTTKRDFNSRNSQTTLDLAAQSSDNHRPAPGRHLANNLKLSLKPSTNNNLDNSSCPISSIEKISAATSMLERTSLGQQQQHEHHTSFVIGDEKQQDGLQQQQQQPPQPYKRKVRLPRLRVVDMTPEEQEQWEKEQLKSHIDVSKCHIDEAPFQLVEQTSLYRVHTLFSMLGLNHAYVTSFGRLVGIVALKDIRYAIERMLQEK